MTAPLTAPSDWSRNGMAENDSIRFGDPRMPERFWSKVRVDPSGCWIWTGSIDPKGYGRFAIKRDQGRRAHRVAVTHLVGPIPAGLECDHLCRVPCCVNPAHIELVTGTENNSRSMSPTAVNKRKTHCMNGHAFTEENTKIDGMGSRRCRICLHATWKRYKQLLKRERSHGR